MSRQHGTLDFFAPAGKSLRSVSGQELKERGIAKVRRTNLAFIDMAIWQMEKYVNLIPEFTMEDFRTELLRVGNDPPNNPNAWGALARVAAQQGLIVKTGEYRAAQEPAAHGRMIAVWRRA